jgi:ribose transport system permease protein
MSATSETKLPGAETSLAGEMTKKARQNLQTYTIILALIGIWVLFTLLTKGAFLTPQNFSNLFRQMTVTAFLAIGMVLVIVTGGIDLSVGKAAGFVSVIAAFLQARYWVDALAIQDPILMAVLTVIISLLVGTIFGAVQGSLIAYLRIPPFIVTLSTMNIARGVAYVYTGGSPIRVMSDEFNFIGSGYLGPIPMPVIYSALFIAITAYILTRTKLGRHIYAVGGNREAARFAGINPRRVLFFAYAYSGLMAGISGVVLASRMFSGQPTAGDGQEMEAIAATVLGGTSMLGGQGAMGGTVIGVLIMGALQNGLNLLGINSFWQYVVKGAVILLAVYIDVIKKRTRKVKLV